MRRARRQLVPMYVRTAEGAKTSAMPERRQGSTESVAAYGASLPGSFAFFDRDSCSWRTYQRCFSGELEEWQATWPVAGTIWNGFAFPLPRLVPPISGTGCSLWDGEPGIMPSMTASLAEKKGADYGRKKRAGGGRGPDLQTFCIMYPTLTANMGERGGRGDLHAIMKWQANRHMGKRKSLAVLAARDFRSPNRNGNFEDQLPNQIGGTLNPTWCEWYQGFPTGWSELEDSATA